jgi:hypothetical protein
MSNVTVKKVLVASMGAALAGALAHTSSAGAAVLSASNGFADDSTKSQCFQRSWQSPGQVRYKPECSNNDTAAWYDIPMPIFATGNKNFSVYVRTGWPSVWTYCDLFVVGANGTISRWNEQEFQGVFQDWVNFPTMAVNSNESAIIECFVPEGPEGSSLDSFISAVKGF